jgi:protein tyrosine phosphatase (PTP) superfamily phosphohydrolase (DUF442 family)
MNIEASYNFRRISDTLTTSGVVRPDGLKSLTAESYEVVVNLLPDTSEHAIAGERDIVESQSIEYIYIPVDFKQPSRSDFALFSKALDQVGGKKTHVHCAANYRVSAFYSLYLVTRGHWSADRAFEFIHGVWQPADHPGWSEFISDILAAAPPDVAADRADGPSSAELRRGQSRSAHQRGNNP